MFQRPHDRPPSRFKTRYRKRKRSKSKKKYTPPLYSESWGEDYTVTKLFPIIINDLFSKYVDTKHVGKYELWTWKGTHRDIWKIQLQLSWVMGARSLELNNPSDLIREIVSRYQEYFSHPCWTFEYLYGDVCYSIPK